MNATLIKRRDLEAAALAFPEALGETCFPRMETVIGY